MPSRRFKQSRAPPLGERSSMPNLLQQTRGRRTRCAVLSVLQDDSRVDGRDPMRTYYERVQVDRSENVLVSQHEPLKLESYVYHPIRRQPVATTTRQDLPHLRGHQRAVNALPGRGDRARRDVVQDLGVLSPAAQNEHKAKVRIIVDTDHHLCLSPNLLLHKKLIDRGPIFDQRVRVLSDPSCLLVARDVGPHQTGLTLVGRLDAQALDYDGVPYGAAHARKLLGGLCDGLCREGNPRLFQGL